MDYRRLRSTLRFKALAEEDRRGDHITFRVNIRGKDQRLTKMSHSAKGQISKSRLADFSRQMGLTGRQMGQFVDCSMSREEWVEVWRKSLRQV